MKLLSVKVEGDKIIFRYGEDISDILKANYEDRKNTDEIWKVGKEMKLAGRIPPSVWSEWEKLGLTGDSQDILTMLEKYHPEYKTTKKILI
ncbi:MAG: hypothetical protein ACOYWZ_20030 [Bacillota bacterium]